MSNSPKVFQPISCLCTNIKMASRAAARYYDTALSPTGMNVLQYAILANIGRYQPVQQSRLAEHLEMERTTLYRALAILEKQGLITTSSSQRGPAKTASLTEQGEEKLSQARELWQTVHQQVLDRFGDQGLEEINGLLSQARHFFAGLEEPAP